MALTCPYCGTANGDGAKFCKSCGQLLAMPAAPASTAQAPCGQCGTTNSAGAKFCRVCGTPLAANAVAASGAAGPMASAPLPGALFPPPRREPAPLPMQAAPVSVALPGHPSGDTSQSPLWLVLIAGLVLLALAAWWYLLRPAGIGQTPPDVATTVTRDAADSAQDTAAPADGGTAVDAAIDVAIDVEQAVPELGSTTATDTDIDIDTASAPVLADAPPAAVEASPSFGARPAQAVREARPAANTAMKLAEKPPGKLVARPVQRQVLPLPPETAPAPPPLRFIPVDPQGRPLPQPVPAVQAAIAGPPSAAPVQTAVAAPSSPEQACGKRVFVAMTMCMSRQCETPQFASHPQCVQLRQQNRDRQNEVNQGR